MYSPAPSISNMPGPRESLAAAACNGKVYAIGGESNGSLCSDVFVYDPAAPAAGWSAISNLPAARGQIAAASVSGKVYAVGGFNAGSQSSVYEYDPNQPQLGWTTVSNLPYVSHGLGAAAVSIRRLGRAIDAEVFRFNDKYFLYFATRDPDYKIQMQEI
jgi:N-acetylneuraminic acid mutarotase